MHFYDIYARNRPIPMSRWVSRTKGENPGNFDSESRKCPEKLWYVWVTPFQNGKIFHHHLFFFVLFCFNLSFAENNAVGWP